MDKTDIEFTGEFGEWWDTLTENEQESVDTYVHMLEVEGVRLGHPYSSKIQGSRHSHMRELRVQHAGQPYRVFYCFDPRRVAILLCGGCKVGDDRFYDRMVPVADRLYDEHLAEIA